VEVAVKAAMDRVRAGRVELGPAEPVALLALLALVGGAAVAIGPAAAVLHLGNAAAIVLIWAVGRLLGLAPAVATAAAAGYSFLPGALALHRDGGPVALATPLLLAAYAVVLLSRRQQPVVGEIAAAGLVAAAVLVDPAALLFVPAIPWQWQLAAGRPARPVGNWVAVSASAALALGWGILIVVVLRTPTPTAAVDVSMTLVVPAAAAAFAARARRMRPLAAAVLVLTVAGLLDGWQRTSIVAVALPAAGLVLAEVVGAAAGQLRRRDLRSFSAVWPLLVVAFAALAGPVAAAAGPAAAPAGPAALDETAAAAEQAAVRWLAANLGPEATVAADSALQATAKRAGISAALTTYDALGPDPASVAVLAVTATTREAASADAGLASAVRRSRLIAAFGEGTARVELRRTQAGPGRPDRGADDYREAAARREAGADLAANPRLALSPAAREAVRQGGVDPRLLGVLAAFVRDHDLSVSAFPTVQGEEKTGALLRVARITAVGGEPVRRGGLAQEALENWLAAQRPPHVPLSVVLREEDRVPVVEVTYDAATEVRLAGPPVLAASDLREALSERPMS
jgi:putative peptide zinc metalloprotease protein